MYATLIVVLVFVPLFALPGIRRQFVYTIGDRLCGIDLRQYVGGDDGDARVVLLFVAEDEADSQW